MRLWSHFWIFLCLYVNGRDIFRPNPQKNFYRGRARNYGEYSFEEAAMEVLLAPSLPSSLDADIIEFRIPTRLVICLFLRQSQKRYDDGNSWQKRRTVEENKGSRSFQASRSSDV